jgi:hypothetical protein
MSQDELIEQIVTKVSERVLAQLGKASEVVDGNQDTATPAPKIYGIRISGRLLGSRCFKVVGHEEERFVMLGEQAYPVAPRLVLHLHDRSRIAIPKLDSLTYSVYPIE